MGKYLDIVKRFEEQQAYKQKADAEQATASPTWLCPHCGELATIDDVCPSYDKERILTLWSCESCEVVAATPAEIRQPPSGWVSKIMQ